MRMRSLFRWHLGASLLFFLGTLTPVVVYGIFYFYKQDTDNKLLYMITEAVSWAFMAAHVLPEFVVDLNTFPGRSRKFSHFRYGPTPCPNMVQSLVFAAAAFFQGVFYYTVWSDGEIGAQEDDEKLSLLILNSIAGHLWLVSGVLAIRSIGFRLVCCGTSHVVSGGLEQSMSDFFVISTLLLCIASYLFYMEKLELGGYYVHILVRCVWALLGLFYLGRDIAEIAKNKRQHSSKQVPLTRRTNEDIV